MAYYPSPFCCIGESASQTVTSSSTSEEFSLTEVTSFPPYSAPTTTVTGAAETSSVIAIAPLFTTVWKNRGNLLDLKTKDQYIDDVTNTKNQVDTLYNNLPDKSDPPTECSNTSGSGSLISGIKNVLTTPAKLISCAAKVVGNLANIVNAVDPVISTVETLTDTLQDIGNELEKSHDDNPTSSHKSTRTDTSATDSITSSTSSGCSITTAVSSCSKTVTLLTSWYTDSTTTTSDVKTVTTVKCATISGCSARATTATTTVSTATTSSGTGWICDSTCAAGGCAISRRTAQPTAASDSGVDTYSLEKRNLKPTSMIKNVDSYIIQTISSSGSEGLDWNKGIAVSKYYQFLNKGFVRYVAGVTGCTSIVITSEKGAWVSHFMETGLMDDEGRQPERNSLDKSVKNGNGNYVKPSDLAGDGGDLNKASQNVQVYVSGPCITTADASGNKVCKGEDNAPTWEYDRIDTLLNTLFGPGTPFEGVTITKRGYIKPTDRDEVDSLADTSARGKVVVQYDANQLTDQFMPYNPKHAAYRVWLESSPYQQDWVASSCQGGNAPNQKRDGSCPNTSGGGSSATESPRPVSSSQIDTNSTMIVSKTTPTSPSLTRNITTSAAPTFLTKTSSLHTITSAIITSSIPPGNPQFESVVTFSSFIATVIS
ncbi:uncharacterized protein GGS22DRAFT_194790 [Annulohypoxylon maeteangense]|uniref:uncharacterized protein n=1 Tax=Annulohypoxylon maeteangense TaxID=1927788 RepID=UPI0020073601|nr:uncharacterized protein GGS22DRAFT_194790 [Annulohypoxylon maeteangense]KAI0884214.1 hypothetical protein GGS22DRAFT_194790 [Annulohypoxylon maeteangense]